MHEVPNPQSHVCPNRYTAGNGSENTINVGALNKRCSANLQILFADAIGETLYKYIHKPRVMLYYTGEAIVKNYTAAQFDMSLIWPDKPLDKDPSIVVTLELSFENTVHIHKEIFPDCSSSRPIKFSRDKPAMTRQELVSICSSYSYPGAIYTVIPSSGLFMAIKNLIRMRESLVYDLTKSVFYTKKYKTIKI